MSKFLIKLFIKENNRESYGVLSGFVGIACNIILSIAKFIIGTLTASVSITADALNNLSDAGSNIFTIAGAKLAAKPVDRDHPFGHGRMEYITALVMSFLILLMSFELGKSSIEKIINPSEVKFNIVSLVVLLLAIGVKLWMAFFNNKLFKLSDNINMKAVAKDSLGDCISTIATIIAMLISHFTSFKRADGIIGIFVAILILISGIDILKEVLANLIGKAPEKELVESIERIMLSKEEIVGVHDLIVHDYGPGKIIASAHAEVPCDKDILDIHDVIDNVEAEISRELNIMICIHMDPIAVNDANVNKYKAIAKKAIKGYNEEFKFHDFRVVEGTSHTNLIFDLVVPHEYTDYATISKEIRYRINEADEKLFCVITVEHDFV